jgi:CubicO group peptidase (beta-lactamase class C family)
MSMRSSPVWIGLVLLGAAIAVSAGASTPRASFALAAADFSSALAFAEANPPLTSVVIATADSVLAEGYWRGAGPNSPVNAKSVAKSVLAALVGIALARGEIDSLGAPIHTWLPDYARYFEDPAKRHITLEDLLTMRTGLQSTSFSNYGAWVAGSDWVRGQLRMPVEFDPGTTMRYSTGASHIVSVVLERATGRLPRRYAAEHLFGPIGVHGVGWDRDPQGHDFGGNNLSMTPRQMARFGQLHLADGVVRGRRILPEGWVRRTWQVRTISHWNGYGYGYAWWYQRLGGFDVHFAWGHGGQRVYVIPEAGLVVVTTAGLRENGRSGGRANRIADELVERFVLSVLPRSRP